MQEVETTTMEETAQPVQGELKEEPKTEKQLRAERMEFDRQRRNYITQRKSEIEVLELDTRFLELQVKHYDLSSRIAEINKEIKEKKASEEFKEKIKV